LSTPSRCRDRPCHDVGCRCLSVNTTEPVLGIPLGRNAWLILPPTRRQAHRRNVHRNRDHKHYPLGREIIDTAIVRGSAVLDQASEVPSMQQLQLTGCRADPACQRCALDVDAGACEDLRRWGGRGDHLSGSIVSESMRRKIGMQPPKSEHAAEAAIVWNRLWR
jgi:hypothetical protein